MSSTLANRCSQPLWVGHQMRRVADSPGTRPLIRSFTDKQCLGNYHLWKGGGKGTDQYIWRLQMAPWGTVKLGVPSELVWAGGRGGGFTCAPHRSVTGWAVPLGKVVTLSKAGHLLFCGGHPQRKLTGEGHLQVALLKAGGHLFLSEDGSP